LLTFETAPFFCEYPVYAWKPTNAAIIYSVYKLLERLEYTKL
jgi:hypothetical protein